MSKTKKRIAIVCMVLNIIMLSQLCFGSVSAFYDAVTSLAAEGEIEQTELAEEIAEDEDEHICEDCDHEEAEELQAEPVCSEEEMQDMKCAHNWVFNYRKEWCSSCAKEVTLTWEFCYNCPATRNFALSCGHRF